MKEATHPRHSGGACRPLRLRLLIAILGEASANGFDARLEEEVDFFPPLSCELPNRAGS
jgi:hypothetical protein